MVEAIRRGKSLQRVAHGFHVAKSTVEFWVKRAKDKRLVHTVGVRTVNHSDTVPNAAFGNGFSGLRRDVIKSRGATGLTVDIPGV